MKTILIIALVFVASAVGTVIAYRSYQTPPTTDGIILRDVTESFSAQPSAEDVLKLFDFNDEQRWNGARFVYSEVTDVSFNRVREVSIASANKWLSNELERDRQVKQFENGISAIINTASKDTIIGTKQSSVYIPIAQALTRLSESRSDKKVLIVYSDLMENTTEWSFYDNRVFAVLNERPDSIVQAWEVHNKLPTLAGIEVYLIYQPADVDADITYQVVSAFYKKLLESKGAVVHISANLLN